MNNVPKSVTIGLYFCNFESETITKALTLYNENKLAQGRDSAKQIIEDNPELMKELESKIKEKINN